MLSEREIFIALVDNDFLQISDAIVLLEGDGPFRIKHAIELFTGGWAKNILLSGGNINFAYGSYPLTMFLPEFYNKDIPKKSIICESVSQNTREQAIETLKIAIAKKWKKIILVASAYHQYRAYLTFLSVFLKSDEQITIINSPVKQLSWFSKNEWGDRYELLFQEFKKIEQYRMKGHIASYQEAIEYQRWKERELVS
ncbi:MAG: YdcF family protein [Oligoflexia bacterium]|nr:YdcF family protein [Oligoflexia bacterium]